MKLKRPDGSRSLRVVYTGGGRKGEEWESARVRVWGGERRERGGGGEEREGEGRGKKEKEGEGEERRRTQKNLKLWLLHPPL
ncbi:MAG: hypothetical protein ACKESB_03300 [Candidatus Hodgkinia cicadicola]